MPVNPAFLTFNEYLKVINPDGTRHDSSAYQVSVDTLNTYQKPEEFPRLLQQFHVHGRMFELKEKQVDRWAMSYAKKDDNGDLVRDEQGRALDMDIEEVKAMIPERYQNEHAIIDQASGQLVACTANEWGCLLIQVAEEYQGLGLGPRLSAYHRERYPERPSGGMTNGGQECCYRAYQAMVARHLSQGKYREALMEGDVSLNRIVEILKSARVGGKYVAKEKAAMEAAGLDTSRVERYQWGRRDTGFSLDMTNPADLLLYADDQVAILYSRHLYALIERYNDDEHERLAHFIDEGIAGYAYVGGTYDADSIPKLYRLYGRNDNIKSLLTEIMMNTNIGEPVRLLEDQKMLLERRVVGDVALSPIPRSPFYRAQMDIPTMEWLKDAQHLEAIVRKQMDNPYGEHWGRIQEVACGIAEHALDRELEGEAYRDAWSP